jgi:hypothetical protein
MTGEPKGLESRDDWPDRMPSKIPIWMGVFFAISVIVLLLLCAFISSPLLVIYRLFGGKGLQSGVYAKGAVQPASKIAL